MKRIYLPIILALLCAAASAADSLTLLQLRNRPAAEVIPVIEPLLGPGDRISGQGFKIFLRASPQTLSEVRELIAGIDVAAQALMISVMQGSRRDVERSAFSGSVQIENGKVSGRLEAQGSDAHRQNSPLHRLRVTEGSEGFIETGPYLPLYAGDQAAAGSGFYVLPRLHGDDVTLQISTFSSAAGSSVNGQIDTLRAHTTVTGRLGEWLPLGGVDQRIERSRSNGVSQSSTIRNQQDSIWIRADLAE